MKAKKKNKIWVHKENIWLQSCLEKNLLPQVCTGTLAAMLQRKQLISTVFVGEDSLPKKPHVLHLHTYTVITTEDLIVTCQEDWYQATLLTLMGSSVFGSLCVNNIVPFTVMAAPICILNLFLLFSSFWLDKWQRFYLLRSHDFFCCFCIRWGQIVEEDKTNVN